MAVVDRIFDHARQTPDRAALADVDMVMSYRDLAAAISQTASRLEAQATTPDRVAVIAITDIVRAWIAGLAVRALGMTTVIARSAADIARLRLDAGWVVCRANESAAWTGLDEAAAVAGAALIRLGDDAFLPGPETTAQPPGDVRARGGHILLTSGTTGDFKKALITPAIEDRVAADNAVDVGFTAETSICVFSFGGWTAAGYFWPVCVWSLGGCVILHQGAEPWRALKPPGAPAATIAVATPPMIAALTAAPAEADFCDDALRLFAVAGILSPDQWRAARERITDDIWSIYGATEPRLMTFTPLRDPEDLRWHRINPTCEMQVVDETHQPLPAGEVGFLRTRPTRVDGYLDDPEASAAFFRDGFFYPGDLGVLDGEGRLWLQGRATAVINVQGDKLGTLPIEQTLQDRLGAEAVCVFSVPGPDGEVVHVAIQRGRLFTGAELREALEAAMPAAVGGVRAHMVEAMPRNHMGKIERVSLMAQLLGDRPGQSPAGPEVP